MLYSGEHGCGRAKWLYSGTSGVFGQSGCVRAKVVCLDKSDTIRSKWLYLGKSGCILAK